MTLYTLHFKILPGQIYQYTDWLRRTQCIELLQLIKGWTIALKS